MTAIFGRGLIEILALKLVGTCTNGHWNEHAHKLLT